MKTPQQTSPKLRFFFWLPLFLFFLAEIVDIFFLPQPNYYESDRQLEQVLTVFVHAFTFFSPYFYTFYLFLFLLTGNRLKKMAMIIISFAVPWLLLIVLFFIPDFETGTGGGLSDIGLHFRAIDLLDIPSYIIRDHNKEVRDIIGRER